MFVTTFTRNAVYNLTLPTILYIDAHYDHLYHLKQMYRSLVNDNDCLLLPDFPHTPPILQGDEDEINAIHQLSSYPRAPALHEAIISANKSTPRSILRIATKTRLLTICLYVFLRQSTTCMEAIPKVFARPLHSDASNAYTCIS